MGNSSQERGISMSKNTEGLTLNQLAERNAEHVTTIESLRAQLTALTSQLESVVAENAALMKFCKGASFDADYEAELGMERGGFTDALNDIKTPATAAFLAEVRASGVDAAIEVAKNLVAQEFQYKDFDTAQRVCSKFPESDLVGKVEMVEWLADFAAQLRQGGAV